MLTLGSRWHIGEMTVCWQQSLKLILPSPIHFLKLRASQKATGTNVANFLHFAYVMKAALLLPRMFTFYAFLSWFLHIHNQGKIGEERKEKVRMRRKKH